MNNEIRELRTPEKQLLIGVISNGSGDLCLVIKNRGKEDSIPIDVLVNFLKEYLPSTGK